MGLRGWSWDAVAGPAGAGNRPLLEALEAALPDAAVEDAIERTGTRERRRRVLPTHLVVALVVAMGLWAAESVRHALAAVVDGWAEARERRAAALGPVAGAAPARWRLPSTAALVRARRRVGVRLFREVFHAVAGPIATRDTAGAFLGGRRLMAVDGTTLDVADTLDNARAFGRPTTSRGVGAFPQLRAVALIETGTHALCDVVLRSFRGGEAPAARHLLRSVGPGMLLLWDRGFHGYDMIQRTLARGAASCPPTS
jgi:Insertion element 4 transposase N-terminal/Transposase DDE domain